jgi:hypothetical protein
MGALDDGGPAFPTDDLWDKERVAVREGMSLRDWFAGQVLGGNWIGRGQADIELDGTPERMAQNAYRIADAMLEARK